MDTNKETTTSVEPSSGNCFNVNPYLNSLQSTLTSNYTQVPPGYPIGNPQVPPGYPPGYHATYYPSGTGGFPIYSPGYEEIFLDSFLASINISSLVKSKEKLFSSLVISSKILFIKWSIFFGFKYLIRFYIRIANLYRF